MCVAWRCVRIGGVCGVEACVGLRCLRGGGEKQDGDLGMRGPRGQVIAPLYHLVTLVNPDTCLGN